MVLYDVKIEQKEQSTENYSTHHEQFVSCLPKVFTLPDLHQDFELGTPYLRESLTALVTDN